MSVSRSSSDVPRGLPALAPNGRKWNLATPPFVETRYGVMGKTERMWLQDETGKMHEIDPEVWRKHERDVAERHAW